MVSFYSTVQLISPPIMPN